MGIPLAVHKTVGPSQYLEYLGTCIGLDSDKMEARLPHDKLQKILETLTTFLEKSPARRVNYSEFIKSP